MAGSTLDAWEGLVAAVRSVGPRVRVAVTVSLLFMVAITLVALRVVNG